MLSRDFLSIHLHSFFDLDLSTGAEKSLEHFVRSCARTDLWHAILSYILYCTIVAHLLYIEKIDKLWFLQTIFFVKNDKNILLTNRCDFFTFLSNKERKKKRYLNLITRVIKDSLFLFLLHHRIELLVVVCPGEMILMFANHYQHQLILSYYLIIE